MIENEKDLVCSNKHNQPIVSILINHQIPVSQRLLCALCIAELEDQSRVISIKKAKNLISQKQEKLQEVLNESTKKTTEQLNVFKQKVDNLKSNVIQQFDYLLKNSEEWVNNLIEFKEQKSQYNLKDEIERLDDDIKYYEEQLKYEFNKFNFSYFKKIETKFQIDGLFQNIISTKQAIDDLNNISEISQRPCMPIEIKQYDQIDTPHFPYKCSKHDKRIIQVDLRKDVKKEDRMKCVNCQKDDSITVTQFVQQWEQYHNDRQQKLNKTSIEQQQKFEQIKKNIYTFIVDLSKIMRETVLFQENNILQSKTDIQMETSRLDQLTNMAETLCQIQSDQKTQIEQENLKINEEGLNKLFNLNQYLNKAFETFSFQTVGEQRNQSIVAQTKTQQIQYNKITYQLVDQMIKQQEYCAAISFNHDGSIMAAACDKVIKIWKFENGKIDKTLANLQGHTGEVYCLVYSKSRNWIASGSNDCTIRLWKDMGNNQWQSLEQGKIHKNSIFCLLMNRREDQLISGSCDKTIKIWNINYETNQLTFSYSLDKHSDPVYSLSLNETEISLVSCSYDKQILIWEKGENQKWEFKEAINKSVDDFGFRVCFINDQMIAWLQFNKGYTHIFKLENGKFIEKQELKIELKQDGRDYNCFFPPVFIKQRQLLILKHNKYVYIIRQSQDGKFKIECDPIDCSSDGNFGALSNDGQFLAIWNNSTYEIKVYRLIYE